MKKLLYLPILMICLYGIMQTTSGCKKNDPDPTNVQDTIQAVKGKLFINEIFSKSNAVPAVGDWVELYNSSDSTLKITDTYSLSDSFGFENKFLVTKSYFISPKSYLVIECDGLNECSDFIHTSFKLSSTGEQFGIYNAGTLVDSISFPDMSLGDISYGRSTNGGANWTTFTTPTKGASNN